MLGGRKFALAGATNWPESLVQEFIGLLGPLCQLDQGSYHLGVADRDFNQLDDLSRHQLNSPGYAEIRYLSSILICESHATVDLLMWLSTIPLRLNAFDSSALSKFEVQNIATIGFVPSVWALVGLASVVGMRLPTESEWEAAVFRARTSEDRHGCFVHEAQRVKEVRANFPLGIPRCHSEFTSSVGFAMDVRERGDDLEEWELTPSLTRWPGIIARGNSDSSMNRYSRFSHRYGTSVISARFCIELSLLQAMDMCPLKEALTGLINKFIPGDQSLLVEYRSR
jgi:hypothetical protein